MTNLWRTTRSFPPAAQVLMVNQFAINLAFYMLMPYLAAQLAGPLGLAAWAVGLVLGVRNLSQQGMFLVGGTLADRYGYKTLIMAGCLLRTAGFALLGLAESLPALVVASAATGFAGALFNPAVRAYLAAEAGERRVEAFAAFNVYYQAGMLLGPLVGLALLAADFTVVCAASAAVFAGLTLLQARALPSGRAAAADRETGVLAQWRVVAGNRPFVLFSVAMIGSYVLTFQVYLTLPLAAGTAFGNSGSTVTSGLFVVSAGVAVVGQLRLTGWAKRRCTPSQAVVLGLAAMGAAFVPLACTPPDDRRLVAAALFATVALLAVGGAVVYPFEMDTVVTLARGRLVASHYGLYNTVSGVGITLGNLVCGALWDWAGDHGALWLVWAVLASTGAGCALAVRVLAAGGGLSPAPRAAAEEPAGV
ncbi:MFS transporter [Yinghuangia seranimata]|uniref:MFS transporter n=1 Tax=Yinghuangia seranimata TaxID=408067 RepID=UPI00248CE4DD|nr:MFS transporter [Yinghuangia seranimata]MDI2131288.1 MFS transporter [Yinghuangia seranimata]